MKNSIQLSILSLITLFYSGCLWITRIPLPSDEKFSDLGDCTNRVWRPLLTDLSANGSWTNWTAYPLIGLRVHASSHLTDDDCIPLDLLPLAHPDRYYDGARLHDIKWQRRFRPLQYVILWIGSPIDALVDTLFLPLDLL